MHSVSQSCFRGKNLIAYCINFFVLLLTHICEILYLWHWSVKCLHFDPYQYVLKKKLHYLQKLFFLCLLSLALHLRSSGNFNFRFTRDLSQEFSASVILPSCHMGLCSSIRNRHNCSNIFSFKGMKQMVSHSKIQADYNVRKNRGRWRLNCGFGPWLQLLIGDCKISWL